MGFARNTGCPWRPQGRRQAPWSTGPQPASGQHVGQNCGLIIPHGRSVLDKHFGQGLGLAKQPCHSCCPKDARVLIPTPANVASLGLEVGDGPGLLRCSV